MNTIMHIAHRASATNQETEFHHESAGIRLQINIDNTELRLINGLTRKLEIVHSVNPDHQAYIVAEELIAAQKKVSDAIRLYEDRIYKRVPQDIA